MTRLAMMLWVFVALVPRLAFAQAEVPSARETIEIGLSTNVITITSDFTGAELTIFGAVDNFNPLLMRQGFYDIVVVLEGPSQPLTVRRKERVFGIWINRRSVDFVNIPSSYLVSTTRAIQDIASETTYRQLSLGPQNIYLAPSDPATEKDLVQEFQTALRLTKRLNGVYDERVGGVRFLSASLFRATFSLPASVPLGTHRARAFLFKKGVFMGETSAQLHIRKSGFEQAVFRMARDHGPSYGLLAVALAMVTGWLGRVIFKRD